MSFLVARRRLAVTAALTGVCLSAACAISVSTEVSPTADFSALHTYAWEPSPQLGGTLDASLTGQRIHADVDRALQAHGFRPANGQPPDMLVAYRVMLRRQLEFEGGPLWGGISAQEYTDGTLVVILQNPQNRYFLWRGVAQGSVDPDLGGSRGGKDIDTAVEKMFAKFPK